MTVPAYICPNCNHQYPINYPICPNCQYLDGLNQVQVEKKKSSKVTKAADFDHTPYIGDDEVRHIKDVQANNENRYTTYCPEFDRVLGGGLIPGSMVLLGGPPGIGKSTLLLKASTLMSNKMKILYISGEENAGQIKIRLNRMSEEVGELYVVYRTNLEKIIDDIQQTQPNIVVIDSVNTLASGSSQSAPGSVQQIRYCATQLQSIAKARNITMLFIGQVTKDGKIAGPMALEHVVDTVLFFEGEEYNNYRILRTMKNRFGSPEVGIFEMTDAGIMDVTNPSERFIGERSTDANGTNIGVTMDGLRPMLIEVQALVTPTTNGQFGMRRFNGVDRNRTEMLIGVLAQHLKAFQVILERNVYVNLSGGIRINEPSLDLPILMSLISSMVEVPVPLDVLCIGEVSLTSKVSGVNRLQERVNEAAQMGFKKIVCGGKNDIRIPKGVELVHVKNLKEAFQQTFGTTVDIDAVVTIEDED